MEDPPKKRIRTENWLEEDRLLLKELVKERVHILENKCTEYKVNIQKKEAWSDLQANFNALCAGVHRTVPQLRNTWGHMKVLARRSYPEKQTSFKTECQAEDVEQIVMENDPDDWLYALVVTKDTETDPLDEINEKQQKIAEAVQRKIEQQKKIEKQKIAQWRAEQRISGQRKPVSQPQHSASPLINKNPELEEAKCRLELQKMQMENLKIQTEIFQIQRENERKRSRILDLELDLMKAKFRNEE